ncbi:MAG: ABC transporter ATP-binding protein [Sphingomonas fennica]
MDDILTIRGLTKRYKTGHEALKGIDLAVRRGEIFALLGPNGAGKTTLIGIVCGTVVASGGTVTVDGHDHARDYRAARRLIGLVPQELATDMFETVWSTVRFSRGLFGLKPDDARLEQILKSLALWEKRDAKISALSGGMKRRVLIAKALAHEPRLLFLDEPSAGVDVELRREMWRMIGQLRDEGVTIILTTHYIEEAEEMADRIGVIDRGRILLTEEKAALMARFGSTTLTVDLAEPLAAVPAGIAETDATLTEGGHRLTYVAKAEEGGVTVPQVIRALDRAGVEMKAIETHRSSLEEIFVDLVERRA